MKKGIVNFLTKYALPVLFFPAVLFAQEQDTRPLRDRLHFGGNVAAAFGSGHTDVVLAPGVLYDVNDYFSAGVGLQGSYVNQRDYYSTFMYGGSVLGLVNPIPQLQLSAELEQLRVNLDVDESYGNYDRNFWNTALFFGIGYRANNVTIGLRYNVLFKERELVYSDALMPFIRVYF